MKKLFVPRMWQAILLAACFLLTVMTTGTALATAESGDDTDRSIFYGKVTAVSGNSITVAIATLTMPEGFGQRDNEGDSFNGQNSAPGGNSSTITVQPDGSAPQGMMPQGGRRSFADNLTYTGESVTVQITGDIVLTKQGSQEDWGKEAPNPPDPAAMNSGQGNNPFDSQRPQGAMIVGQGPGFMSEEASLEDITVDCIVVLTYQTSTQELLSLHILSTPQTAGE